MLGATGEICAKITPLTPEQINILERIADNLQLIADIAHADISIYCIARDNNYLVVAAEAKPNTMHSLHKKNLLGQTILAAEEPLVLKTLQTGENIVGIREMELGVESQEQETFPVYDMAGQIIAAVSMDKNRLHTRYQENVEVLSETARLLVQSLARGHHPPGATYRPISARDGLVITDSRGVIVFANPVAISIYKLVGVGSLLGKKVTDRYVNERLVARVMAQRMYSEQEQHFDDLILFKRVIPVNLDGKMVRAVLVVSDVTELRKKEKELLVKSAVIQEIHHRVKNNLQTIASLLRLQVRRSSSPEVQEALRESINRILSIAVVHEFLSQQDSETINIREVTKNILDLVMQNMLEPGVNIQTVLNGAAIILPSQQATSIALVINELIQNAVEHAFIGRREGMISVDIIARERDFHIIIRDDGVGLPPGFQLNRINSLGLQIVQTLVRDDLGGEFTMTGGPAGTQAVIVIPREHKGG